MEKPATRPTPAEFVQWNDEMASRFDPEAFHQHGNPLIRRLEARRVRVALQLLAVTPADLVVEVGCGPGDLLLALPRGQACGVDISLPLLRRARQRLAPGVPLLRGDGERLPLGPATVDRLLCSEVLEHTLRPDRVLAEIARVLRPGGRAVVSIPEEARINQIKELVFGLGLGRLLGGGKSEAPGAAEGYSMTRKMDDAWHLHAFDLALLRRLVPPELYIERVVSLPTRLLPLRRVVALVRRG